MADGQRQKNEMFERSARTNHGERVHNWLSERTVSKQQ